MKNIDKFMTYKDAENAFLTNCCGIPTTMAPMFPWDNWDNYMKNRYKAWLFENISTDMNENNMSSGEQTNIFSNSRIYWTNPPCYDTDNTNESVKSDYDKIAKECIDEWFKQRSTKRPYLNKDRFDDFNSAWLCFEYECEYGDEKSADIYFSRWLFYPYNPSIVKVCKNGCKQLL